MNALLECCCYAAVNGCSVCQAADGCDMAITMKMVGLTERVARSKRDPGLVPFPRDIHLIEVLLAWLQVRIAEKQAQSSRGKQALR